MPGTDDSRRSPGAAGIPARIENRFLLFVRKRDRRAAGVLPDQLSDPGIRSQRVVEILHDRKLLRPWAWRSPGPDHLPQAFVHQGIGRMSKNRKEVLGLGTRAIHAGQSPDPSTGAIMV